VVYVPVTVAGFEPGKVKDEGPVSGLEKVKLIEELRRARDMAWHRDDAVLRYLIDMAILEAQANVLEGRAKPSPPGERLNNLTEFPGQNQHPARNKIG
jgi:hypothetical protein